MQWTERQQEAIIARDCNLLVAAAAGSGKTAVLVERILSLMNEGIPIGSFLVVTFTKAAAAEMRERLLVAMGKRAEEGTAAAQHFAEQTLHLQEASISTLHSFCLELVQTHFQAADVDPAVRVLEQEQASTLMQDAMEETLNTLYAEGAEDFLALDEAYREKNISEMMETLYSFIRTQPEPWAWLAEAEDGYQENSPLQEKWFEQYAKSMLDKVGKAILLLAQAKRIAGKPGGSANYELTLEEDQEILLQLLPQEKCGYDALRDALLAISFARIRDKGKECDEAVAKEVRGLRDKAKRVISEMQKGLKESSKERVQRDLERQLPMLQALHRAVYMLDQAYTEKKREKNAVDFGDLEHLALRAVRDEGVAAALREKYAYIFVDEYQDSSSIQETLLQAIKRDHNCFFVGDVKQSIYRFRQAKPELFLEKYHSYTHGEGSANRRIDLNQNFRAQPKLLQGVNEVFTYAMQQDVTEIAYDTDAMLYPGLAPAPEEEPIYLQLGEKHDEANEEKARIRSDERLALQAEYVADVISGIAGQNIWDAKINAYRRAEYRDIVILMRSVGGHAHQVERALQQRDIPVYSDVGSEFFEGPEIRLVLCYLRLIDNPIQDEPLLAALRNGLPQIADAGLMAIRLASPDSSFYEAAKEYAKKGDALANTLQQFFAELSEWRLRARYQPLADLIDLVSEKSGCYARAGALPGGRERQANLRLLSTRAASFEANGQGGLSSFLRDVEQLRGSGDSDSAKVLGEQENVVRILTMHKSKGLEFPIVFCLRLDTGFSNQNTREQMLCHATLGIAIPFVDAKLRTKHRTLAQHAILARQKQEQIAEEIRLLYVAMTRAKQRLYLIGDIDATAGLEGWRLPNAKAALPQAGSMLDVLLMAICSGPGGDALEMEALRTAPQRIGAFEITRRSYERQEKQKTAQEDVLEIPQGWRSHEIVRQLTWRPSHRTEQPALKTSVSALLREATSLMEPELIEAPEFLTEKKPTGAQAGSAWHALLRALPLEKMREADTSHRTEIVMHCLNELVKKGVLTEEIRIGIRISQVLQLFESDIGKRMLASPEIHREWAFNLREELPEGGFRLVQGVVDCAFREEEAWVLVDYKTDAAQEAGPLVEKYAPQLAYYAKALDIITKVPVKACYLYLVRWGETFSVSGSLS